MAQVHANATTLIRRLAALIHVLREGPCTFDQLYRRLLIQEGDLFEHVKRENVRRMIHRDLQHLADLGILVERDHGKYRLHGGVPVFTEDELRTLALIRDTFDHRHPQATQVKQLLQRLTLHLTSTEQRLYERRVHQRPAVRPAIDYAPFAPLIEQLESAIDVRRPVSFCYENSRKVRQIHRCVHPYEIEFYDRHFYLVAYTENGGRVLDFRISRISDLRLLDRRLPPGVARQRQQITFRYRLTGPWVDNELSERFEEQRVIARGPDGVVIEAKGRSEFFIIQTLLRYRSHAEVLEPPALRRRMMEEVRQLAQRYELIP